MSPDTSDAGQETASHHEAGGPTNNDRSSPDRDMQQSSTTASQTRCSICQSTFRRPEHLKRHFRSHTKEKPFECAQCGRHFSRTDTLHRHELSHHNGGMEGGKDRTHRITVKTFRACYKCAIARVRCSGGSPCSRCENRSLECQYPTERRSKAKARKESQTSFSNDGAEFEQSSRPAQFTWADDSGVHQSRRGDASMPPPLPYQMSQFQLHLPDSSISSASSSNVPVNTDHAEPVKTLPDDANNNRRASVAQISAPLFRSNANGEAKALRVSSPQSTGGGPQRLYTSTGRMADSVSRSKNLRSDPDEAMPSMENLQAQMQTTQPVLNQSTSSTINWTPQDLLSTSDDRRFSINPSSGPSGPVNSLGHAAWFPSRVEAVGNSPLLSENISQTPSGNTSLGGNSESPSHGLQLNLNNSARRPADHYTEGAITRFLNPRREQDMSSGISGVPVGASMQMLSGNEQPHFSFPLIHEAKFHFMVESQTDVYRLEPSMYDKIHKAFMQLCSTENLLYPIFDSGYFPNANTLSSFIHLYFDHFQPVYPIFHVPTFDPNKQHWLVVLALSAIGVQFAEIQERNEYASAFNEFLRRAINVEKEKSCVGGYPVCFLQAMALNCIGSLYNSDERVRASTLDNFGNLVGLVRRENLLGRSDNLTLLSSITAQEPQWDLWVENEIKRRSGYIIWLLDCTIAYHFDTHPLLCLDDGQAVLPSHEALWQAESAEIWKQRLKRFPGHEDLSLYDAVLVIYIEKKLVPDIGEFSQILLIHALYHRMWEVGNYFRRPLSFWVPTSKKQSRNVAIPSGSVWLPGIPSYSKWRNSACDCLDILHWAANGPGLEHPPMLHLHSARIILLAPFSEIRSLATSLTMEKARWGERQQTLEWHYILRWVRHDQYKARLAVLHAGATLWHIRECSSRAFHEPMALFLATLTLWAYAAAVSPPMPDADISEAKGPMLIHLDRPCEDELVQLFVRAGFEMKGILTGVGDFCAPQGPVMILRAGCRTLSHLNSWGISRRFMAVLTKLADLVSQP
ncbi:hypothetical protein BO70DRAFT_313320 [Aspergillus heteromorphus CBS 117.55]|uniref:C2H2 transcription factor n=1 Tax=Aspergillus heteromorphus CBS 117.55 TaxID=1448321 RepID=A0A317WG52_9EURO|nr:uncharacterized protein BO70DRAFT_313320 [Aspergillus heteromorphus CBS 117.55]PWY84945.1 hypothetical protein BO70DRAFT_313320 [Aspergillus heteromorphus CBS 117.55]